jgi:hypothetical protein
MGTWGIRLYDNDDASDLRDDFKEAVRANWDGARLLQWAIEEFPAAAAPGRDGYSDLRLALADLFWLYGIEHPDVRDEAFRLITDGTDLELKRSLGMSDRDLARRAKVLDALATKWQAPNPKPRPRRMRTSPEAFVLKEGDCLVYPTSAGRVRNPYVSPRKEAWFYGLYPWTHDGWAAAIVLACRHRFETFARYLVAVLRYDDPTRPEPGRFADLSILRSGTFMPNPMRRVHLVSTTRPHLERMQVEVVANLPVNADRVTEEFGDELEMPGREFANDAWTLPDLYAHRPEQLSPIDVDDPIRQFLAD